MNPEEAQRAVVPLGRDGRPKPLRPLRVRPAGTLKEEHEQVLSLLCQNFCRLFAADLSTFVGSEVDITLAPVQQWSWDDLLNVLPEPYCAVRLTMAPIGGTGLMILDVPMAIAIIEKLLGGAGVAQESAEPLTEVELALLSELHQRAASDLAESLALLVETQPVVARQESRLELIRATPGRSLLIGLEFDITMHDAAGHFRVAIPASGLLAKLEAFTGTTAAPVSVGDTGRLGGCSLETSVRFNETPLASRRVVDLVPGDVVVLNHRTDEPLTLFVGDVPYLSVLAGRRGAQKAFAVVGLPPKKGADH
jgi:flagellar motor switch protein FliM